MSDRHRALFEGPYQNLLISVGKHVVLRWLRRSIYFLFFFRFLIASCLLLFQTLTCKHCRLSTLTFCCILSYWVNSSRTRSIDAAYLVSSYTVLILRVTPFESLVVAIFVRHNQYPCISTGNNNLWPKIHQSLSQAKFIQEAISASVMPLVTLQRSVRYWERLSKSTKFSYVHLETYLG